MVSGKKSSVQCFNCKGIIKASVKHAVCSVCGKAQHLTSPCFDMQHDSDICRSCAVAQTIKELIPAGRGFPEEEGEGETIGSQESERSVEDEEASESSSLGDFIVQDSDVSSEESEEDEEEPVGSTISGSSFFLEPECISLSVPNSSLRKTPGGFTFSTAADHETTKF